MPNFLCCFFTKEYPDETDALNIPDFRWEEILQGTGDFRETQFLGKGDFGKVYRCDFPLINKMGAAKIQHPENPYARAQCMAEINALDAANHPNVIKLIGTCVEIQGCVLVYEFMPNGSLDQHLYARKKSLPPVHRVLDWEKRMKIALGVAEALVYLHQKLKVIHGDVKESNILLDENFLPKLSDFGLATKIFEDENGVERQSVIFPISESPGSVAPETQQDNSVSTKSDVYSYGVFLLTLFTGREAYDLTRPLDRIKLTDWIEPIWKKDEYLPLALDVELGNRYSVEGLERLIWIARKCTKPEILERPNMGVVEQMVRDAAACQVQVVERSTRYFRE